MAVDRDQVLRVLAGVSLPSGGDLVSRDLIRALAVEMGGWVVTSSTSFSTNSAGVEVAYGNITVRVHEGMDQAFLKKSVEYLFKD